MKTLVNHVQKRYLFDTFKPHHKEIPTIFDVRKQLQQKVGYEEIYKNERVDKQPLLEFKVKSQNELPSQCMHVSFAEAIIPLGRQPSIRNKYVNFLQNVRFGRLLEDLDTMAVHISYLHNHSQVVDIGGFKISPIVIVTGLVDKIEVKNGKMAIDKDLKISGFTSWVGATSSEITMRVEQEISTCVWSNILEARFLVCARDALNKGSALMNPLDLITNEEKVIYELGERNKKIRQAESQQSLFKVPPTTEDSIYIHEIFKSTVDLQSGSINHRVKPSNSMWMEESALKNVILCQPEQRNLYNKIFGGFLMRQAFELAFINASLFCNNRVEIQVVDDITFRKPVEVGSLLFLNSRVVFTERDELQLKVFAEIVDPLTGARDISNEFFFKFLSRNQPTHSVKRVIPKTYAEAMLMIEGKRRFFK